METQTLLPKAILASAATLLYLGIVEHDGAFTLIHWGGWLFFTTLFLVTLIFAPKFFRTKTPKKITTAQRHLGQLVFLCSVFLICWLSGFNALQTVAFCIGLALLLLGLEFDTRYLPHYAKKQTPKHVTTIEVQGEQG